jgi:hypothetical protein
MGNTIMSISTTTTSTTGTTIDTGTITLEKIMHLFRTSVLLSVQNNIPRSRRKVSKTKMIGQISSITPTTQNILDQEDSPARKLLLERIRMDDAEINNILLKSDNDDPDYVDKMRANMLGFFMEDYVAVNMKCPLCGGDFYVFENPAMPVVDLACSNRENHISENTCYLYQIKITTENEKSSYFSLENKFISVGSRKYGEIPHSITPKSDNKWICPGYICLVIDTEHIDNYYINYSKSFILIPEYQCDSPDPFYQYLEDCVRPRIQWNTKCVKVENLRGKIKNPIMETEIFAGYRRITLD